MISGAAPLRVATEEDSRWCILRTAASSTLPLVEALNEDSFGVWTPVQVVTRRVPRSKEQKQRTVPMMPTFLFAPAQQLHALIDIAASPVSPYAGFSIFRYLDRIPLLADASLDPLRLAEHRSRLAEIRSRQKVKQSADAFDEGETVKVPSGAFAGMSGIVEESNGKCTLVCFAGRISVKIDTFLLRDDEANSPKPLKGTAALAA